MAKRGRKSKAWHEANSKEVGKTEGASVMDAPTDEVKAEEPAAKKPAKETKQKPGDIVKVKVTPERWAIKILKGGRKQQVAVPWTHTVKYEGKFYAADEEIDMAKDIAEKLLEAGTVYLASEKPEPFTAPSLKSEIVLGFGVQRREDVAGKIPASIVGEGDKGQWEDIDDDI